MEKRHLALVLLAAVSVFLTGCPAPNYSPASLSSTSTSSSGSGTDSLQVTTDAGRNQGILVVGSDARMDINAVEDDGTTVNCVDALAVAPIIGDSSGNSASASRQCIIIGTRADGAPGAWSYSSNRIQGVIDDESGKLTSSLPETDDRDRTFRGQFGWAYHVMGVSEDGRIVVGYAENKKGFSWGQFTIDPGTTVGVYWQVSRHPVRPFLLVSRAHIIGTFDLSHAGHSNNKAGHWLDWVRKHILDQLKWFLLDYLTDYLVMVDKNGVHFDSANKVYLVTGTDQDNQPAVATIDKRGNITITETTTLANVDLVPASLTYTGSSIAQGSNLSVALTIQNLQSGSVSQSFGVDYYLALTSTFNPSTDSHLGSSTVSGIGGSTSTTVNASLPIPSLGTNSNQDVYIYAQVDAAGVVSETNKANNISTPATAGVVLVYDSSNPSRTYKILLDTYAPTGSGTVNTGMALWVSTNLTAAVASSFAGGSGPGFAQIDTTLSGGLPPGTYYAVVIAWSNYGPYAMSIRTANIVRQGFATALASNAQDPYEPDDTPQVYPIDTGASTPMSIPTNPAVMKVGSAANRYLAAGDWDWFTFTLP